MLVARWKRERKAASDGRFAGKAAVSLVATSGFVGRSEVQTRIRRPQASDMGRGERQLGYWVPWLNSVPVREALARDSWS